MREILFRAKRIDNGEWVVGSLLVSKTGKTYIRYYPAGDSKTSLQTAVDPNTVCQYTGFTDENGTKIFEGDIVRVHERGFSGYLCVCSFLCGAFGVEFSFAAGKMSFTPFEQFRDASFTPVGNVHDNPELLEVSK